MPLPQKGGPQTPHPLLDNNIDNDTFAATPIAGDLIAATNPGPKWNRLSMGHDPAGATAQVLRSQAPGVIGYSWPDFSFDIQNGLGANAATLTATLNGLSNEIDLKLIIYHAGFAVADKLALRFNADNGANYDSTVGENGGFSAWVSTTFMQLGDTSYATAGLYVLYVQNVGSLKFVTGTAYQTIAAGVNQKNSFLSIGGVWAGATTISSITLLGVGGQNLLSGENIKVFGMG